MRILRTPPGGVFLVGMAVAVALLGLAYGGATPAAADTPTPTAIPNYPAASYTVTLDCGTSHTVDATITFTKDGAPEASVALRCPPQAFGSVTVPSDWNDLDVAFTCLVGTVTPTRVPTTTPTPTPAATLHVPSGRVVLTQQYYLPSCPPLPGTPTPGPTTPTPTLGPGDPYVVTVSSAVGGIAEMPSQAGASGENVGATTGGSGWSSGAYAALAAGLAAAVLALGAGAWYARRRWLR